MEIYYELPAYLANLKIRIRVGGDAPVEYPEYKMQHINFLGPGSYVGHIALERSSHKQILGVGRRHARLMAKTDVRVAVLTKVHYHTFLEKVMAKRMEAEQRLMNKIPYFDHLSKFKLREFFSKMKGNIQSCVRGQKMLVEGSQNQFMFIISSGCFTGYKKVTRKDKGNQKRTLV